MFYGQKYVTVSLPQVTPEGNDYRWLVRNRLVTGCSRICIQLTSSIVVL